MLSLYPIISFSLYFSVQLNQVFCDKQLTIIHTGCFKSKFSEEKVNGKMMYGIGRLVTYVNEQKKSNTSTLYVDNMNWWTGSLWYSIHRWKICAPFVERLPLDAMSLGVFEMGDGPKGKRESQLRKYLLSIKQTVLCANCDVSKEPMFKSLLQKSKILDVSGIKVGITAYIWTKYSSIMDFGKMEVTDELEAVQAEVDIMKRQKPDIIVVLANGMYDFDISMARKLNDVDVIAALGCSTFLYNGTPPVKIKVQGPYPTIVKGADNKEVLLICSGYQGKFVGRLELTFDENGTIVRSEGNPVHMDETIKNDPETLELLTPFEKQVNYSMKTIIGRSLVFLNGSCRYLECSLGNVITDSIVDYKASSYKGKYWSDTPIAFINSGSIRDSIVADPKRHFGITLSSLYTSLPFANPLIGIKLYGRVLRKTLEHAASREYFTGGFLQVSGIKIVYDMAHKIGERTISVQVRCGQCDIPAYNELVDEDVYNIVTNQFVAEGGDGYDMLANDILEKKSEGVTEDEVVKLWLGTYVVPVQTGLEERIIVYKKRDVGRSSSPLAKDVSSIWMYIYYSHALHYVAHITLDL